MSNVIQLRTHARQPRYEDWIEKTGIPSVDWALFVAFSLGRKVERDTDDGAHWDDLDRAVRKIGREHFR